VYIASNLYQYESGALAIAMMGTVVVLSTIGANYLYRWIEVPGMKLKV
jgi:peptidoglycan/LPS O-acetylase OafA/YrhL